MLKKRKIGIVKKRDILDNRVKIAYLGIGSNIGNKRLNIEKTKFLLQNKNLTILKSSSFYETKSWPNEKFPNYLNIILKIKTNFSPYKLFKFTKKIEKKLKRKKAPKNYPRTCDIDIIDYDKKCLDLKYKDFKLTIPHPRLHVRNFVLLPLFEISKNWKHPRYNQKISNLLYKIRPSNFELIKLK